MIKTDIIEKVSASAEITKVKAGQAVEAVLDAMKNSMKRGERIELRGFGVFQVKPRKGGIGRNPRSGKEVRIPPGGRTIRFKPGKDLQEFGVVPEAQDAEPAYPEMRLQPPAIKAALEQQDHEQVTRFHELVDAELAGTASAAMLTELRRLEATLDAADEQQVKGFTERFERRHAATMEKLDRVISLLRDLNSG